MLQSNLSTTSKKLVFAHELARFGPDQTELVSLQQALAYCSHWATSHPENFIVASVLLPRSLRQDFHNIYAYCRWSDDLADEIDDPHRSLLLLDWWQSELELCPGGQPRHPILKALQQTLQRHNLPLEPFADLLSAFRQDQQIGRYANDWQLLDYCRRSANPVGRILLQLARAVTPTTLRLSDAVCSGLQLANFCQDMSRDAQRGRIYLPRSRWLAHDVDETMLLERRVTPQLRSALAEWVATAQQQLLEGWPLLQLVPRWLRTDIDLFVRGGLAVLQAIEAQQFDVWTKRPQVSKWTQTRLLMSTLLPASSSTRKHHRPREKLALPNSIAPAPTTARLYHHEPESAELRASRRWCAQVCRQSKSSFLASFALLDPVRRQAMYALYAFARLTDDLGDNSQPAELRAAQLQQLSTDLWQHCAPHHTHTARNPQPPVTNTPIAPSLASQPSAAKCSIPNRSPATLSPLWPALSNCVERFQIPVPVLDDIIAGVSMDVQHRQPDDWDDLQLYCYHVASAVGLACSHIWRDSLRTTEIPTQAISACGVAFQLTNILRDIGEDARSGRIYVPKSMFDKYAIDRQAWLACQPTGDWQAMLDEIAQRAGQLYLEGWPTVHTLTPRSGRMFSLIWHSYRSLLPQLMTHKEQLWTTQKVQLPKRRRLQMLALHALAPIRLLIR